jgi:ribonuclease D
VLVHFINQEYYAPNLCNLLSNPEIMKIFHFARFDVAAIKHSLCIEMRNIFCTKIASKLVRTYTDSHGLKELCRELLGIQLSKQQQSSYWGSSELSKEQIEYAGKDVLYLHKLRDILIFMLKRENRYDIACKLFAMINVRSDLDLIGWNDIDIFAH